jgi:GrpB-like predicted nucleotidyltransferase (UPF0157 family)
MPEESHPIIGPYETRPAVCRDYDPRAAALARQIAALISKHLPEVRAEHIGSTSVPGCAGKGIVDLLIAYADQEELEAVKELLERLGFQPQGGRDPFPEDQPMWVGSLAYDGEVFLLHVHVIPEDSSEVDEIRFFRACLRADPDLMKAYVARKRAIIDGGVTDSLEYCRLKGEFVKEVLGK